MTILTMDRKELEKRVGKISKELEKKITDMGTPVEELTDSEVEVELFPNRPDLLSLENFARAVNQFNGKGKVAKFRIYEPEKNYEVIVEKSVKVVRPFTVCAIIKGLKFSDSDIKNVVDLQEKLHNSIGRKRKKAAIGIYPLDKISLPIRFVGRASEDIKFLPLEASREMNARQILKGHPTGREYAHLLEDTDVYPVFIDANDDVLSMPPIINSEKTGRIDEKTRDVFIECSGHNLVYLKKVLNILLASISEMGGKIYAMNIKDSKDGSFVSPDMGHEDLEFKIEDIEKTLGISLKEKEVRGYLNRMGIGMRNDNGKFFAEVPCYRADILHWIDLTEEVAIAYGYDNFVPEIPEISTIAEEDSFDREKRAIGNILAGLGMLECNSFHLTTKKNIKKMHYEFNDFIEVEESKTERDVLRMDMMTNMLQILSENSDAAYPQKVFEVGRVFALDEKSDNGVREKERLAIAMVDEKMGYTEMKQVLDYLFKMLGLEYIVEDVEDSNYIVGRCGKIVVDDVEVGRVGEVAPRVLRNWKIRFPVVGCEIGLGFL
ncbi:phenylalanine--tRNA ligase subunit beta [archaeon]|jgi:phenylalanyl-tRNA synthetase beta chain|nr:phenylalanine--tRNA ligase subunit beta [archaeon]MBT7128696.1 phenylalanine--tRNA ligase subunit beta [archaeon]